MNLAVVGDGSRALPTGPAADRPMETGAPVRVADLLDPTPHPR